ncbi:hypothetical protein HMPREF9141_0341 [Prevotella multiformis DSM 16608]|uniref:Uncharacterized protein n=1 Tax=Prevotella multiformis DSM 16608 TaxID=888743 RepID=F0F425_9BACT|nr:hypothetical protein HMPREF9141_0341 [Prevotella multiformis DSM 16608]
MFPEKASGMSGKTRFLRITPGGFWRLETCIYTFLTLILRMLSQIIAIFVHWH